VRCLLRAKFSYSGDAVRIRHDLARDRVRPLVLAIGFFDGFHRGHREVARQVMRRRRPGWRCGVLTFANHPATHLRPGTEPPLINTAQERLELFARAGFEECFFVRFDERIATLSPAEFLGILTERLNVRAIAVGATFRFGHKRAGDVAFMDEFLSKRDVEVVAVEAVCEDGARVSSTRIRSLIAGGETAQADQLLGGTGYEIRGPVEIGAGRGHDLGFPTANLCIPEKLLPKDGVYAATARYDGRDYAALVSIGTNPQFGDGPRTVEAWLRDFHQTIYGRELALRDFRYVREQRLFGELSELIEQMQLDLQAIVYPSYG
jgi:riboflavin kinase / FMN adenylyltransferase